MILLSGRVAAEVVLGHIAAAAQFSSDPFFWSRACSSSRDTCLGSRGWPAEVVLGHADL